MFPYLIDKIFKGFHPKLINCRKKLSAGSPYFLSIIDQVFQGMVKLLSELGGIEHQRKVLKMFVERLRNCFIDADRVKDLIVYLLNFLL